MKTLVIGATGTVGSLVVRGLLTHGQKVSGLTRSADKAKSLPAGCDAVVGDLLDPASIMAALSGIDALFLLNAVAPTESHEALLALNCARASGIKRIVYLSVMHAQRAPHIPHFGSKAGVELAIQEIGLPYTILQPNMFNQNDAWLKEPIVQHGVYPNPIGNVGVSRVDARDIADAAVNALLKPGFENTIVPIVGPKKVNGAACAEVFAQKLGKKVVYGGNDLEAWAKHAGAMMPAWMVFDLKLMFEHFQKHGLVATDAEVASCERLVGHPLRTFDAFVEEIVAHWK